jgi:hypothetical protein
MIIRFLEGESETSTRTWLSAFKTPKEAKFGIESGINRRKVPPDCKIQIKCASSALRAVLRPRFPRCALGNVSLVSRGSHSAHCTTSGSDGTSMAGSYSGAKFHDRSLARFLRPSPRNFGRFQSALARAIPTAVDNGRYRLKFVKRNGSQFLWASVPGSFFLRNFPRHI